MTYLTVKYIKGNPYLYEVRSVREGDRVRQVFVRYLGRADKGENIGRQYVEPKAVSVEPERVIHKVTPVESEKVIPEITTEITTPEQIYDKSLEDFRQASRDFAIIRDAYQAKEIGDAEFLKGKAIFNKASQVADAAETDYINTKKDIPVEPTPPDIVITPTEIPLASDSVSGLIVRKDIPNQASIESSLEDYEILPGIREIPTSETDEITQPKFYSVEQEEVTRKLAEEIKESGEINPLILVITDTGDYILEGSHRLDALRLLGIKSFPAQVVIDRRLVPEGTPTIKGIAKPTITHEAVIPPVEAISKAEPGIPEALSDEREKLRDKAELAQLEKARLELEAKKVEPAPVVEVVEVEKVSPPVEIQPETPQRTGEEMQAIRDRLQGERLGWQVPQEEYISIESEVSGQLITPEFHESIEDTHRNLVQKAIREGEDIPREVLRDYPNLVPQPPVELEKVMPEVTPPVTPGVTAPMSVKTLISLNELEEGISKEFAESLDEWTKQGTTKSLNNVARLARTDPRYRAKMLSIMKEQYGDSIIVYRAGEPKRPIISVTTSEEFAASRAESYKAFRIRTDDIIVANPTMEHELLVRATKLKPELAIPKAEAGKVSIEGRRIKPTTEERIEQLESSLSLEKDRLIVLERAGQIAEAGEARASIKSIESELAMLKVKPTTVPIPKAEADMPITPKVTSPPIAEEPESITIKKEAGELIAKNVERKISSQTGEDTDFITEYRLVKAPEDAPAEWMGNPWGVIRTLTVGGEERERALIETGDTPYKTINLLPWESSYKTAEKHGIAKQIYDEKMAERKAEEDKKKQEQKTELEDSARFQDIYKPLRSSKGAKLTTVQMAQFEIDKPNIKVSKEGYDVGSGVGVVIHGEGKYKTYTVTHLNTGLAMGHEWKDRLKAIALAKAVTKIDDWSKYETAKDVPKETMETAAALVRSFTGETMDTELASKLENAQQ